MLRPLFESVPNDTVTTHDADGWSPRDVVAHLLIINDLGLDRRLHLMVGQDDPFVPDVNEHTSLDESGYRERPLADLLDDFAARRADTVGWMRSLRPADLERTSNHEITGRATVTDVVHHIAFHDLVHVAQIANQIAAPLNAARGGMSGMGSAGRDPR